MRSTSQVRVLPEAAVAQMAGLQRLVVTLLARRLRVLAEQAMVEREAVRLQLRQQMLETGLMVVVAVEEKILTARF
jgi:hypothetical protein